MFARTERGYIYTTTGNQVYGQQVGGKLTPYPCVAGVSPADLAAAAGADLVGSVVDVNRARRFVLTVVAVETAPEGAVGCEIDRLWWGVGLGECEDGVCELFIAGWVRTSSTIFWRTTQKITVSRNA